MAATSTTSGVRHHDIPGIVGYIREFPNPDWFEEVNVMKCHQEEIEYLGFTTSKPIAPSPSTFVSLFPQREKLHLDLNLRSPLGWRGRRRVLFGRNTQGCRNDHLRIDFRRLVPGKVRLL